MATPAVLHGESHLHMTDAAEITVDISLHGKRFGPLFLDVKNVGMATGAIKLRKMFFMGEGDIAAWGGRAKLDRYFQFRGYLHGRCVGTD